MADDNTLWIGMTKCNNGERFATGLPYGCLTMYNTSTNTVTMLEPYLGDATGIADVTGLHKVYVAQGGQVYIFSHHRWLVDQQPVRDRDRHRLRRGVIWMRITDANNTVY